MHIHALIPTGEPAAAWAARRHCGRGVYSAVGARGAHSYLLRSQSTPVLQPSQRLAGPRNVPPWGSWPMYDGERRAPGYVCGHSHGAQVAPRWGTTVTAWNVTVRATVADSPPLEPLFAVVPNRH